ncbi:MAG: DUF4388 domain-containing protein [Acidobacteria bacterium]|nr:DUF4388 domain-containing protein [Acidobacteriota bacterium]
MTGDLKDFSLTDILQMLSLTRKTGMLFLETKTCYGQIVIEDGKITYASLLPGESFAQCLVRENKISFKVLAELRSVGLRDEGIWTLQNLIVESGLLDAEELNITARRHLTTVVGNLISIKDGRFGIELNRVETPDRLNEIRIEEGLEVGEILLTAVSERDEAEKIIYADDSAKHWADDFNFDLAFNEKTYQQHPHLQLVNNVIPFNDPLAQKERLQPTDRALLLLSMLTEMRTFTSETEIILLIMRYASEVASRGILFSIKESELSGVGQFDILSLDKSKTPDQAVREIRIPIGDGTLFDGVLWNAQPFIGAVQEDAARDSLFRTIGGIGTEITAFAMPLYRNNQATWVIYGDNYPDLAPMEALDGLIALVTQASLVLDKIDLEHKLNNNQASH